MTHKCMLLQETKLNVKRQTNLGCFDGDGFATEPKTEEFEIVGSIQPISAFEALQVEENDRKRGVYELYTEDARLKVDDVVIDDGIEYEVRVVNPWRQGGLSHTQARIVRIDVAR